jgi:hypothetical protein
MRHARHARLENAMKPFRRQGQLPFKMPFAKAVQNLRQKVLNRDDYDPAVLFVWGQMNAVAVIEMLKEVEARCGTEGQRACIDALERVGQRMASESLEGVEIPADLSEVEVGSLWCSWINEIFYASIEEPSIEGPDAFSFEILYCPHQDIYSADDCRVQRYLVQGMTRGFAETVSHKPAGGTPLQGFNAAFERTIPAGAPTCIFRIWRRKQDEATDAWRTYSDKLAERALRRAGKEE